MRNRRVQIDAADEHTQALAQKRLEDAQLNAELNAQHNGGGVMMGGPHDSDSDEEEIHRRMTPYSVRTRGKYTFDSELPPARFWRKL